MGRAPCGLVRLWLGTLAGAGVVLSHGIAYRIWAPDPAARADLLESSGHRYWTLVVAVALGTLVGGLSAFVGRLVAGRDELPGRAAVLKAIAPRLALIQCAGFIALEAGERALAGGMVSASLMGEPVVAVGVAVQGVVALAGALLLLWLGRAVVRVSRWIRRRRRWAAPTSSARPGRMARPRARAGGELAAPRGPPSVLPPAYL